MRTRAHRNDRDAPISIYEVHLGSWRRKPEEGNRRLTYRELADELVPYVKDLGFTHIELMPINEHPVRRVVGLSADRAVRADQPLRQAERFRALHRHAAHEAGLGVLLDWVAGHFPGDAHGLACFDGTHLYEHADPREGQAHRTGTR